MEIPNIFPEPILTHIKLFLKPGFKADMLTILQREINESQWYIEWVDEFTPSVLQSLQDRAIQTTHTYCWNDKERYKYEHNLQAYLELLKCLDERRYIMVSKTNRITWPNGIQAMYRHHTIRLPQKKAQIAYFKTLSASLLEELYQFSTNEENKSNLPRKELVELFINLHKNMYDLGYRRGYTLIRGNHTGWAQSMYPLLDKIPKKK